MRTDRFVWHGHTGIGLGDARRKATPAFNIELCERFGLLPLEFNRHDDSIHHPFDRAGPRHMKTMRQHGSFDDMPLARIVADFAQVCPAWGRRPSAGDNFQADMLREAA